MKEKTILVIHDDEYVRDYYTKIVAKKLGCKIVASDGTDWKKVATTLTEKPDLVITDSEIARGSKILAMGYEIAEELKNDTLGLSYNTSDIPLIIVSGGHHRKDMLLARKYEGVYLESNKGIIFLDKGEAEQQFAQLVEDLLDGKSILRDSAKKVSDVMELIKDYGMMDPTGYLSDDSAYMREIKKNANRPPKERD